MKTQIGRFTRLEFFARSKKDGYRHIWRCQCGWQKIMTRTEVLAIKCPRCEQTNG